MVDILIVAYLIYRIILFVRRTNSYNIARTIMALIVVYLLSYLLGLTMINYLIRTATEIGLLSLVILFQPELRRVLERVGRSFSSNRTVSTPVLETAIAQTVLACTDMSASRTGALIIFQRSVDLGSIISTGTVIHADVNAELIKNIFFHNAPLHDGAMVIRDAGIEAAGCQLPLTHSLNLSKELGMRHRAGIGMSEQSDAVVIIVSEETGAISMAIDGMLKRHLNAAALTQLLHAELIIDQEAPGTKEKLKAWLRRVFSRESKEKKEKK